MKHSISGIFIGNRKYALVLIMIMFAFAAINAVCGDPKTKPDDKPNVNQSDKEIRIVKQSQSVVDTIQTGFKNGLLAIYKLNAARIVAVGKSGTILTSSNGGLYWVQRTNSDTRDLHTVTMLNSQVYLAGGTGGVILRSADTGKTWIPASSTDTNTVKNISFSDVNNGIAANGTNRVLKTIDGGLTWVNVLLPVGTQINGVSALPGGFMVVCGNGGAVFSSTDMGNTWLSRTSGVLANLNSIDMLDQNYGKIAGSTGKILTTTNGGMTWTTDSTGTTRNLKCITVSRPNFSFACSDSTVLRKQNSSWLTLNLKSPLHSVSIPNAYCNAICDDEIYILSSITCPCTHNVQLIPRKDVDNIIILRISVTPDPNQDVSKYFRIETGGNMLDNTISGWTEYIDNTGNTNSPNYDFLVTRGNSTEQVTGTGSQTLEECFFVEFPIDDVSTNKARIVEFKIVPITAGTNPIEYNVPIYINFLDEDRTTCLASKYVIDCNSNPSSNTIP